ncbi:MAG TPA: 6-phosphogluconolactonase [Cellulomonas sp.]
MRLVIEDDYAALSRTTAAVLLGATLHDRRVNLSVTAGATPVGAYQIVTPLLAARREALTDVHFYNFDEVPQQGRSLGLTMAALQQDFYGPAQVPQENVHVLEPGTADAIRADLRAHGGLDLMLMGLGADAHFCGNMPGVTRFEPDIYTYDIDPALPWAAGLDQLDPVPTRVVTMGAAMVLRARQAVLIVSGEAKADALAEVVAGDIGPDRPATVLRMNPDLLLIADRAATSRLTRAADGAWRRR